MSDWQTRTIRDGLSAATITISGNVGTALRAAAWRTAIIYTFVHSAAGTNAVIRFAFQQSPNYMTGTPASVNAGARWLTTLFGATYSLATGLKAIYVPQEQLGDFGRIGWTVSGTNPRIRASIWAGLKA